ETRPGVGAAVAARGLAGRGAGTRPRLSNGNLSTRRWSRAAAEGVDGGVRDRIDEAHEARGPLGRAAGRSAWECRSAGPLAPRIPSLDHNKRPYLSVF